MSLDPPTHPDMEPDHDDGGLALVHAFATDDPMFVRGFELGTIWEALRRPYGGPLVGTVRRANKNDILRMIPTLGWRLVEWQDVDAADDPEGTWAYLTVEIA